MATGNTTSLTRIIALCSARDDYGLYHRADRGEFGTFLIFRGRLSECRLWRNFEHPTQKRERVIGRQLAEEAWFNSAHEQS